MDKTNPQNKRSVQLALTSKGDGFRQKLKEALPNIVTLSDGLYANLVSSLRELQLQHGLKGFSTCSTCRFNQKHEDGSFLCGLTQESLTQEDVTKTCREHEYA